MNPNTTGHHRPIAMHYRAIELYTHPDKPQTIAEISRLLGLGRETVREHLIRANVPRRAASARAAPGHAEMTSATPGAMPASVNCQAGKRSS